MVSNMLETREFFCSNSTVVPISDSVKEFDKVLGSLNDDDNLFSYKRAVMEDEQSIFPYAAIHRLNEIQLQQAYIPKEYGGNFNTYFELYWLIRLLSMRDLTIAIAHGKSYLGAIAVWVSGSEEQKKKLATLISKHEFISLGLTELEHGSDLISSQVTAEIHDDKVILNGKKWLINNATEGRAITVFAKLKTDTHSDKFIMIFLDKNELLSGTYYLHDKIKTHGIKGADISGISFNKATMSKKSIISTGMDGLNVILRSLQVTRVLCTSLSIGAADTAIRTVTEFALQRELYNKSVFELDHARKTLSTQYSLLLAFESCSMVGTRMLHSIPEKMSLYSSVLKYIVPVGSQSLIQKISVILGARYFLREGFNHGIFQKVMRDNELVSLFDGNTIINLKAIAVQLKYLSGKSKRNTMVNVLENYRLNVEFEAVNFNALTIIFKGEDILSNTIDEIIRNLPFIKLESGVRSKLHRQMMLCKDVYLKLMLEVEKLSPLKKDLTIDYANVAIKYSWLFLSIASTAFFMMNQDNIDNELINGHWLVIANSEALKNMGIQNKIDEASYEKLAMTLKNSITNNQVISVYSNGFHREAQQ